jgi:GMP synthase (glutamine-hydrolysing)
MNNETVIIIDFGGQYKELIARRVRECGVYSEIRPNTIKPDELRRLSPIGIIFTGGPDSIYDKNAPACSSEILELGVPVLGICYGMHYICHTLGGSVAPLDRREYGTLKAELEEKSQLFFNCPGSQKVLMSHGDTVERLPEGFISTAYTDRCAIAACENPKRRIYGVQFHPEVENTQNGTKIINNFLYSVCHAKGDYSMADYLQRQITAIRERVGTKQVLLGLSGGVDSSVCAAMLSKAIPGHLTCIYVDHGFMRKNETKEIQEVFGKRKLNLICVDAKDRFLKRLKGVTDPEEKRKIIGDEFSKVFEDEAKKCRADFLAQGTIYPDVVESGTQSALIKSHHNVGGLPEKLGFEGVVEPLRGLFKDEVRKLGLSLKLPRSIVYRQPFPGPGLSIRIIGEITEEKLDILREADAIAREEIGRSRSRADQYFTVLTNTKSVGVMGDGRTYEYALALRAVMTNDFMTCEVAQLPYPLLLKISSRIANEVRGINRVVYDITPKPPATIEWE